MQVHTVHLDLCMFFVVIVIYSDAVHTSFPDSIF